MNRIPVEILFHIYRQLDIKDLESCSLVCKYWNTLINDICLWTSKCYEKLREYKWIDRELLILIKLCGIQKIKTFFQQDSTDQLNKRGSERQRQQQQQQQHRLHAKSGYYMRKLFYRLYALSNDYLNCQTNDIYPLANKDNITYYKCLMIGPAMDSSQINQCLMEHMIKVSVWNQLPDDFIIPDPYLGTETKLMGKNIMIETPKLNISVNSNTLVKLTGIIPQTGEPLTDRNRFSGIYLLSNKQQMDGIIHPTCLIPEISNLIKEYHVIMYTLDICKSRIDDINWDQINVEISVILNILGLDQSLLIVGVSDKYGQEECLSLTEFIDNLQSTILHQSTVDVLENELITNQNQCVQWRVWLTTSNGEDYNNLTQMINWGLYRNQLIR